MPENNSQTETVSDLNSQKIDTGAACLVLLLRFFGMPGDIDTIRHEFGETEKMLGSKEVLRAARKFGLKSRSVKTSWDRLRKTSLPAIGLANNGQFFVIGQIAEDKILIQSPYPIVQRPYPGQNLKKFGMTE